MFIFYIKTKLINSELGKGKVLVDKMMKRFKNRKFCYYAILFIVLVSFTYIFYTKFAYWFVYIYLTI